MLLSMCTNCARDFLNYLQFIVDGELSDGFPQLEVLLRLLITLPIGISSAERSFSVLRRLKNYLRSTMEQQRTSDLALLSMRSCRTVKT